MLTAMTAAHGPSRTAIEHAADRVRGRAVGDRHVEHHHEEAVRGADREQRHVPVLHDLAHPPARRRPDRHRRGVQNAAHVAGLR